MSDSRTPELEKRIAAAEGQVAEALLLIAKIATGQSEHYGRLLEIVEDVTRQQRELRRDFNDARLDLEDLKKWRLTITNTKHHVPGVDQQMQQEQRRKMAITVLRDRFDARELDELMHDLGIRPENLGGETHDERCRELVGYCERRGRFWELIRRGKELRPGLWPIDTGPLV
ncbi:MAG: hypothetical protein KDE46_02250 [Caldilineaceae bacterium]|nr:hypothetical protein [Anaerolineales bacterium]MCB0094507.1 hypothetical protein [Caldilineaceae bacterium]MCB1713592.1 hypothetical protein [Candidatus Competibacteraceae bacterium]